MADKKLSSELLTYTAYLKSENMRKDFLDAQAHKNYVYYKNDFLGILAFLESHLYDVLRGDQFMIKIMPKIFINDVPKVVKNLCMIYNNTPDRRYTKDLSEDQLDAVTSTYKHYKEFHRLAKLLNTIIVRPIYNKDKNIFTFITLGRNLATVITPDDNQFEMQKVIYPRMAQHNGKDQILYINWTDEEVYITDDKGSRINPVNTTLSIPTDGVNPYGRIPFEALRLSDSDDFWGDGISDYVNAIEKNNGRLTDSNYKQWLSFGYPIGTNLGVDASEFFIAPYNPYMINNLREGDLKDPNLEFITPDHKTSEDRALIDYIRKGAGTSKGLSPGAFSDEVKELSGFAKMIENEELITMNQEDSESLREFEFNLFELMKAEYLHATGKELGADLDSITFNNYEFTKTVAEKWEEREFQQKYGMSTPAHWLAEERGITIDEAVKEIKNNQKVLREIEQIRTRNPLSVQFDQEENE